MIAPVAVLLGFEPLCAGEALASCSMLKIGKYVSCEGSSPGLVVGKLPDRGETGGERALFKDWPDVNVLCQNTCNWGPTPLSLLARNPRNRWAIAAGCLMRQDVYLELPLNEDAKSKWCIAGIADGCLKRS